jgi:hypothetical protein
LEREFLEPTRRLKIETNYSVFNPVDHALP